MEGLPLSLHKGLIMKYHNITKDDMLNGDGIRVVLWVSGCSHHCKGCHNPKTWNPKHGLDFDENAKREIFEELSKDYVSGITFSGGDPLHPLNRDTITELAKEITTKFPKKSIWLYTGYLYEELYGLEVLNYIDVLVDGKFEQDKLSPNSPWVGSSNQRVIPLCVL